MIIRDYSSHSIIVPSGQSVFLTLLAPSRAVVGRFLAAQLGGTLEGFSYAIYNNLSAYVGGTPTGGAGLPPPASQSGGTLSAGAVLNQISPLYVVPTGDALYPQPTNSELPQAGFHVHFPYATTGPGVTGVASAADRTMALFIYIAAGGASPGRKTFGYSLALETVHI